jgi:6-phosphofructokinase 1
MASRIRRIGVLTSGGDSPGFNPCVRAVVRMAIHYGWEPWGIQHGFAGLLNGEFIPLNSRAVSGIISQGGTFLGSSRSEVFKTPHGLREALRHLNEMGIDALVVVGGDGSMKGAEVLQQGGFPTVGIPGTIENDVCGTDVSIGVDTALNTALDAMDRIKDTASSQHQAFLVEMMGHTGHLTLMAALAGGAEMVCIPEMPFTLEDVENEVASCYVRGKKHCIIAIAEGAEPHAATIADSLRGHEEETGFAVRLSILGHIQRGGSPTASDRLLATRLGSAAVQQLYQGLSGIMVGVIDGQFVCTPLAEVNAQVRSIDQAYLDLAKALAR